MAACGMRFRPQPKPERPAPVFDPLVFPQGGWQVHPDSSPEITLDCLAELNVAKAAQELITFNKIVKECEFKPADIQAAFERYEKFLRLQLKHPRVFLIPTLEIELVWQSHMIRPSVYEKDFSHVFGSKILDHSLIGGGYEYHYKHAALVETARLWRQEYHEEYIDLPEEPIFRPSPYFLDETLSCKVVEDTRQPIYYPKISLKLEPSPKWQNPFSLQVKDVEEDLLWLKYFVQDQGLNEDYFWLESSWFKRVAKSYERYLFFCHRASVLADSNPNESFFAHPTYAIDLFWHAHMIHPVAYRRDCAKLVGRLVDHSPWPENYKQANFDETNRIWKEEFGIEIQQEHLLREHGTSEWSGHGEVEL